MLTRPEFHRPADDQAPAWPRDGVLVDRFGRSKRKLRLSLTDRCNFRCGYCMPDQPVWQPKSELLSLEELQRLASLCVERLGIEQIRLTGGEPLLRRDVVKLTAALDELRGNGLKRLALTSNGTLLDRYARPLAGAGLQDVNVSLDSLDPARFAQLTGGGELGPVLMGIEAARAAGLEVKVNAVIVRGQNEDDVVPLARWAAAEGIALRFIEFMPLDGRGDWQPARVVPEREMVNRLERHFSVEVLPRSREPATYYLLDGRHRLGIISTVSQPFCGSCDRVRVTATGQLFPCLFSPVSTDLKAALRGGRPGELEQRIRGAIWHKGRGFVESAGYVERQISMHGLGG